MRTQDPSSFGSCDPRPPRGRRPAIEPSECSRHEVAIPRPPRGRRPARPRSWWPTPSVAIHAPLAGGDPTGNISSDHSYWLRSTPPSREATSPEVKVTSAPFWLRSTPPSREATVEKAGAKSVLSRCDPRPPRGRRPVRRQQDPTGKCCDPRPPRGRRPARNGADQLDDAVAIHAPLAGGDHRPEDAYAAWMRVAIHAPLAGGDQEAGDKSAKEIVLRSTPPSREATDTLPHVAHALPVAIHAPLAGGDHGPLALMHG